ETRTGGRRSGQSEQPIALGSARGAPQLGAAVGELVIERKTGHMRPADGDLNHGFAFDFRRTALRQGLVQTPELEILRPVKRVGESAERNVAPSRGRQGYAERQPVGLKAGWNRDRGEVEQVHEVRIVTEVGVQSYRVRHDLGDSILTPSRWRD